MTLKRNKTKGRKESGSFIAVPKAVLNSPAYIHLNAHAVKLLFDVYSQYNGKNNGDLCATWSIMEGRGWRSKGTLSKALKELVDSGLIQITRHGGRHKSSLYAVTFKAIDECKGKLDVEPTVVPANTWKLFDSRAHYTGQCTRYVYQ